ncbi:hypothetical protein L1987_66157 [Smallanthus sonchifolius]|uniref:Uncharacterized protein n=1 Tax=Smallanthus sonchifolius TaxID=185202 RepID=A0ACB9BWI7_9ASTR|nr:hypothetical protein L1987_66157 [Smallanthus sonchifolius]
MNNKISILTTIALIHSHPSITNRTHHALYPRVISHVIGPRHANAVKSSFKITERRFLLKKVRVKINRRKLIQSERSSIR